MPTLQLIPVLTNRPVIELIINKKPYRFLLDTGATHTVLAPELLPELNKQQEATRKTIKCYGIGEPIHTKYIAICFRFVGVSLNKVMFHQAATEHYDNVSGLIGQDILSQFSQVCFDYKNKVVRFVG
jgi:hypothetical protein